jgi:hypothetical protein
MTSPSRGYVYWVSDEQLAAFAATSYEARFEWLESTRAFFVAAATPEVVERILRLRRGETIVPDVTEDA